MPDQPTLLFHDGNRMPQLGLGFWQVTNAQEVAAAGLGAGYRLLDTAQGYGNETEVGRAIARSGLPREEVFVTTKLRNAAHARDDALRAFDASMAALGLDRLDLMLIHWPRPAQDRYVEAWRVLIELRDAGRIRSIGVSNFGPMELARLEAETGVVPVLNQIELHPRFQQHPLRALHGRMGIVTQSWSPLGQGGLLGDPVIGRIARRLGRSPAQVVIRWHLQEGLSPIPKSAHPDRIRANFEVWDLTLDENDMEAIARLDRRDGRVGPDPATAEFAF